jgi:dephospho-CoA kinase
MIIEFFGLPGAGKTHKAQELSLEKNIPIISIQNRYEKYGLVFLYMLLHPLVVLFFLRTLARENKHDKALLHHKIRNLFFNCIAREQKGVFHKECIIDEGLWQCALGIFEREVVEVDIRDCTNYIFRKRVVFIVETPREERMRRMQARGRVPRGFRDGAYQERWLSVMEKNYYIFKKAIQRFPHKMCT